MSAADRLATPFVAVAPDRAAAAPLLAAVEPGIAESELTVVPLHDRPVAQAGPLLAPALAPGSVVLLDGSQCSRDLAGWLAVAAGARVAWAVESLRREREALLLRRVVNGGEGRLVERVAAGAGPLVLLTRATLAQPAAAPASPAAGAPTASPADAAAPPPLATAEIVVAVGRGIGGPERLPLFHRLARELGAALGATRVVVDRGWLPFACQIGQTGTAVAPRLYVGFGVSGAVQHLVGMRDSETIVAVNSDRDADLCALADLVVEGDAATVAQALLSQLEHHGESPS
jgi:electron transfer flavoprotein alpha subunit